MENYYVEPKRLYKGFPTSSTCVFQEHMGRCPVASPHIHENIEILYCTDGAYKAKLGGVEYRYKKGDLLIINSHEIHQTWADTDGINACWVIQFDPEILYNSTQAIIETRYVMPFILANSKRPRVIQWEEFKNTDIQQSLNELIKENTKKKYGFELVTRACICRMIAGVLRFWNEQGLYVQQEQDNNEHLMHTMQSVLDYVEQHYAENISVSEMAKMCNMSYSYFSRQFKRIIAMSFSDYLSQQRISHGEKLLSSTNKSITEIAMEVGFSDTSYFIQKFKAIKGISPGKFKASYGLKE